MLMTAFNVVRFRVKPGREEDFLDAHRRRKLEWPGMRKVTIIKTGDRSYCLMGEWDSMASMAAARPHMIATLDTFRDTLEDMGGGLGVMARLFLNCLRRAERHRASGRLLRPGRAERYAGFELRDRVVQPRAHFLVAGHRFRELGHQR